MQDAGCLSQEPSLMHRLDSCWKNSDFLFPRMPVSLTEKYIYPKNKNTLKIREYTAVFQPVSTFEVKVKN